MGTFRTKITLENPEQRGRSRELLDVLADGRLLERHVGFAIVHAGGTATADDIVFGEPDDMVLLGARSLEGLNLRVDPHNKCLVPAGPIVAAPSRQKISEGFRPIHSSLAGNPCARHRYGW